MKAQVKDGCDNRMADEMNLPNLYTLEPVVSIKETEKAMYVMFFIGFDRTGNYPRRKCSWIPKSWLENAECLPKANSYDEAVEMFKGQF